MKFKNGIDGLDIFAIIIAVLLAIITLFLLSQCSPQHRFNKLVKKHPELLGKDTITVIDTAVTERVSKDTIFKVSKDTVVIRQDRLTVKHYYHDSTVYLSGECESDTVIREIPVHVTRANIMPSTWETLKALWLPFIALSVVFGIVIAYLLRAK